MIYGGTLLVMNTSGTGTGPVTAKTTATLAGTGSISGNATIESGGFLAPGNSGIGNLTVASATLTGTYQCDLGTTTGDKAIITGVLTINPGAAITFAGTPTAASYIIATYGSLVGTVPSVVPPNGYVLDTTTAGQIKLVKTGYATWADSWTGPALSDKSPGGDPDHDGIKNLMEYVIGGDPRVPSTGSLPRQAILGASLVLSYKRSNASKSDTTQTGQWSTDMLNWTDIAPVMVNDNSPAADDMTISIPLSNAVAGKLFGRLSVSQP